MVTHLHILFVASHNTTSVQSFNSSCICAVLTPQQQQNTVSNLPSIRFTFNLPNNYPEEAPPTVILETSPSWLPAVVKQDLEAAAATIWESVSRSENLFRFVLHIEDESCTAFGLQKLSVVSELIPQLLEFDRTAKKEMFDKEPFECGICLDREMGSTCYRFEHCKHISCISCLQECFNRAIVAGSVDEVRCPSVDCGVEKQDTSSRRMKKVRLISPQELLRIPIERAAVQRFVDMKRKKML
jgi:E3 ubiquitin-protein ligase RNF14